MPVRAAIARALRPLRTVRGIPRIAETIAGSHGDFVTDIGGAMLAGSLASFVERQALLFCGYERDQIDLFLRQTPRGGTVLDAGANIGNHSVLFAAHFDQVIGFEPNPALWPRLDRNVALNLARYPSRSIDVHRVGLSDVAGTLTLYDVEGGNRGLATFSSEEQYDRPLIAAATAQVAVADDLLGDIAVAAVKIDVQGFEPQVLRGMQRLLARSRPPVWVEFGAGTMTQIATRADVEALFPYPISIDLFASHRQGLRYVHSLKPVGGDLIAAGDYLIRAAGSR